MGGAAVDRPFRPVGSGQVGQHPGTALVSAIDALVAAGGAQDRESFIEQAVDRYLEYLRER